MMKGQKGITLVALVITIIVMLILVGVTVTIALQDGGIVKEAQDAGTAYQGAAANDQNPIVNVAGEEMNVTEAITNLTGRE